MEEARTAFGLAHPKGEPRQAGFERAHARATDASPSSSVPPSGSTCGVAFEEVLERSGGLIAGRGAWAAFAEEAGVYELVTSELVEALAAYVEARRPELLASEGADAQLRLMEAGAGNGE